MRNTVKDVLINSLYNPLLSVFISKDELFNITSLAVSEDDIMCIVKSYLKSAFSSDEKILSGLNLYIDKFFSFSNSDEVILVFKTLYDYLKKYECDVDPYVIGDLVSKNSKLNELLKLVFDDYKTDIIMRRFDYKINNTLLSTAMEYYCSINGIEFDEDLDEELSSCSNDGISLYYKDIRNFPVLSEEQEKELVLKAKNGDDSAKEYFLNCNLKLVVSVATKFTNRNTTFDDAIQEGNIGLLKAFEKFDLDKGFKFSTYARTWIMSKIGRAIENNGRVIRIPSYMYERIGKYRYAFDTLFMELGREPRIDEIASIMGLSIEQVLAVEQAMNDTISVEYLTDKERDDDRYHPLIPSSLESPEDIVIFMDLKNLFARLLNSTGLTDDERATITLRFGLNGILDKTLEEVASILNLSKERANQIEKKALEKLLFSDNIELVLDYLDDKDKALEKLNYLRGILSQKKGLRTKTIKVQKTLYGYFSKYDREIIDSVLKDLESYDVDILKLKFGDDYECIEYHKLPKDKFMYFNHVLMPRIRDELKSRNRIKNLERVRGKN